MGAFTAPKSTDRSVNYVKEIYADRSIERALCEDRLLREDANLILEFVAELQAGGEQEMTSGSVFSAVRGMMKIGYTTFHKRPKNSKHADSSISRSARRGGHGRSFSGMIRWK